MQSTNTPVCWIRVYKMFLQYTPFKQLRFSGEASYSNSGSWWAGISWKIYRELLICSSLSPKSLRRCYTFKAEHPQQGRPCGEDSALQGSRFAFWQLVMNCS